MPLYEVDISMWDFGQSLARDAAVNTVWFNDTGTGTDPQNIADDVRDLYVSNLGQASPIEVKVYDHADAKPRPVKGRAVANIGAGGGGAQEPREVALCLSFYADRNIPRHRGRIYLPAYLMTAVDMGQRPSNAAMDAVLAFATKSNNSFPDVGGVDVTWCVFSRKDGVARKVTAGWVDDEWDTVRSRGLRATKRTTFTREG